MLRKDIVQGIRGLLLLVVLWPAAAAAQSKKLDAYWEDGLKFRSRDTAYEFSVGGRVHYDVAMLGQSAALDSSFGPVGSRVQVRRARIAFEGSINKALAYEFEFTFREQLEFADMYLAFLRAPWVDRIQVGYFREPFGLEELTSSNSIVFMERSLTSAYTPGRNTGLMVQRKFYDDRLAAYAGVFRLTDDLGADLVGHNRHSFSGRLAYQALRDTATNQVLHLGAAINRFAPVDNRYRIQSTNEVNTAPNYIDTTLEGARSVQRIGTELGYTKERLFLQAEYIHSRARATGADAVRSGHAVYAQASWFLKGGRRQYDAGGNRFSDVKLTEYYEQGSLSGAWEAALRLSHLTTGDVEAPVRRLSDATLGLNWYYNSNSRIMMNYVLSRFSNDRWARALQLRVQVTF